MSSSTAGGSLGLLVIVLVLIALVGIALDSGWQDVLWLIASAPVVLLILFATWRITAWIEGDTNSADDQDTGGSRRRSTGRPDAMEYGIGGSVAVGAAALLAFWSLKAGLVFIGLLIAIWFVVQVVAPRFINAGEITIPFMSARRRRADLAARADEQHILYLEGDRTGIYGQFMPVDLGDLGDERGAAPEKTTKPKKKKKKNAASAES